MNDYIVLKEFNGKTHMNEAVVNIKVLFICLLISGNECIKNVMLHWL